MGRNGRGKERGKKQKRRGKGSGFEFPRSHGMNDSTAEDVKSAVRLACEEAMASLEGEEELQSAVRLAHAEAMAFLEAEEVKSAVRLVNEATAILKAKAKQLRDSGMLGFIREVGDAALLRSLVDNWVTKSEAKVMLQDVDPDLGVNLVLHTTELLQGNVSDPNRKLSLEKLAQKFDRANTPGGKGFIMMIEGYLKTDNSIPINDRDMTEILQILDEKKGEEEEDDDKTEKRVLGLGKEAEGWLRLMCNTVRPLIRVYV